MEGRAAFDLANPAEVENLAREFHDVYQIEAKRQNDSRHPDDYNALSENTKEYDRVLARHVLNKYPPYHWKNRERFIHPATVRAFKLIDEERVRQDEKWGEAEGRGLHRYTWLTILVEEVGELAKAFLTDNRPVDHTPERRLKEAIQVAAVATAIVEVLTSGDQDINA